MSGRSKNSPDPRYTDRVVVPMTQQMKKEFAEIVYIERDTMASVVRKIVEKYIKRKQKK